MSILGKILGGGMTAEQYAKYKKNAKWHSTGNRKYDDNGNIINIPHGTPYNPGTSYGSSSSSYTPPKYEDYVRNTDLTKAPTAPTFSAAPRAKANTEQFSSKWSDELQAMYDQIANRPKFSYDQNSDPLYQQYAEMYRKNAQLAMDDTVGRAASLTGGYGNSYAETAGQAMYNQQMDNLNQRALDLYYAALDTYDKENQNMERKFNLAGQMYNNDFNAWRAKVADSQWAQNYDFNAWQADVANQQWRAGYDFDAWQANNENQKWQTQYDYNRYINDRDFGYDQFINDRNYNYQLGRDAINDSRYDTEWQHQLEREGIEDERYADELSYNRWRDYIGDMRYDDETKYNRLQDSLDRNLQYYQAGYDPLTGGMSEEARQQYELNLRAQGIDPATGGKTPQAMLEYLAANGNNAGIDAFIDGLTGYSDAQKAQMKAMYKSSSMSAEDASIIKGATSQAQYFINNNGKMGNISEHQKGAGASGIMTRDQFKARGNTGRVSYTDANGKTKEDTYSKKDYGDKAYEYYVDAWLDQQPGLTESEKDYLYYYYTSDESGKKTKK